MISSDERDPLDALAEEFLARRRRGEEPSLDAFAARVPGREAEAREVLEAVLLVEDARRTSGSGPRDAAALEGAPERIGDFRILRVAGRGGMGVVYEAVQESLGRRVALKVLPASMFGSPRRRERFRREAQAAARLHHTNIVPVFGVGAEGERLFYAMQWIEGRGLDAVAADPAARPSPREAAGLVLQAARGLAHAHASGTLHRDVKPANLLLDGAGTVWIADFGLAKVLAEDSDLTEPGDVVGTTRYLPPERFDGVSDARGDVYGLGLTLHELVAGRPAFPQEDRAELLRAVREDGAPPLAALVPGVPADLATIVAAAAARDPADRYASAADLAEDLRRFLDDLPLAVRRPGPLARAWRVARRNRLATSLGALAVVSLAAAAVAGWVGYAAAQEARTEESRRRGEAEAATKRAERGEAASREALEEIFDALASRETHEPPDAGPGPPRPGEQDDAAVLQAVLAFYDRVAAAGGADPRLRLEAARAQRRVGVLRRRLGETAAAEEAFAKATAALEVLLREDPVHREYRLELARTLAAPAIPNATPPAVADAEARARRALSIAEQLVDEDRARGRSDEESATLRDACLARHAAALAVAGRTKEARDTLASLLPATSVDGFGFGRGMSGGQAPEPEFARHGLTADIVSCLDTVAVACQAAAEHREALLLLESAAAGLPPSGSRGPGGPPGIPPRLQARIWRRIETSRRALGDDDGADEAAARAERLSVEGPPPRDGRRGPGRPRDLDGPPDRPGGGPPPGERPPPPPPGRPR